MCMCVCVRACMSMCLCICMHMYLCVSVCACVHPRLMTINFVIPIIFYSVLILMGLCDFYKGSFTAVLTHKLL